MKQKKYLAFSKALKSVMSPKASLICEALMEHGASTVAEVSELTRINRVSVSTMLNRIKKKGVIVEVDAPEGKKRAPGAKWHHYEVRSDFAPLFRQSKAALPKVRILGCDRCNDIVEAYKRSKDQLSASDVKELLKGEYPTGIENLHSDYTRLRKAKLLIPVTEKRGCKRIYYLNINLIADIDKTVDSVLSLLT